LTVVLLAYMYVCALARARARQLGASVLF